MPVEQFHVKVANGDKIACKAVFQGVLIRMQGIVVNVDLFAMPLGGVDVVLGVQWLANLGKVTADYKKGTTDFA